MTMDGQFIKKIPTSHQFQIIFFSFFYRFEKKYKRISTLIYLVVFVLPRDKTKKQKKRVKKKKKSFNILENLTQKSFFETLKEKNIFQQGHLKLVKNVFVYQEFHIFSKKCFEIFFHIEKIILQLK